MTTNVDEEWDNFISVREDEVETPYDNSVHDASKLNSTMDFKNMCALSQKPSFDQRLSQRLILSNHSSFDMLEDVAPPPSDIYISTKSKIEYLNTPIDIKHMFWSVSISPYSTPEDCVIKKQIKFNSENEEELIAMQTRLKLEPHYEEHIIKSINNPYGRIKFKDVRKLSVGMSKKDIINSRSKKKSAFYNCLVLILRLKIDDAFKEFHIKIFNTGKIELPGMQTESIHTRVLLKIIEILQPHILTVSLNDPLSLNDSLSLNVPLGYLNASDTILINSNFNCGFYINREVLCSILKNKYGVETILDSCSYPGIQCKLYYDMEEDGIRFKNDKNGLAKVSFMIFRTGSILIVGMFNEFVLYKAYDFIKELLQTEYHDVGQKIPIGDSALKPKKTPRRKIVYIEASL